MDTILSDIANLMATNLWVAPLLALLAGFLTSFTPCCLANIPIIIGYVGGIGENNPKRGFFMSLVFAIGATVTFMILGLIAGTAGNLFNHESVLYHVIIGILMVLMALQVWGVINIIPGVVFEEEGRKGYLGAFFAGIIGGIFASPCSTPVLIVILTFILRQNNILAGLLLMLMYSLGHNILIVISGTSVSFIKKIEENPRYQRISNVLSFIFGLVILIIAIIMLSHIFTGVHSH